MNYLVNKVQVATYQTPKAGNFYCGDSYFYLETADQYICALADGLGSGELAQESSRAVIDVIQDNIDASPEKLIELCNKQLTDKRGVVLGVLRINFKQEMYSFLSIGNISLVTIGADKKRTRAIPNAGYLAGYQKDFKIIHKKLESKMNFIMFTDGVLDKEISNDYLIGDNVERIISTYTSGIDQNRADDTTLIVMHYEKASA